MRTSLSDLNSYLFETLDRITNEDLTEDQLEKEIKRADTITKVSKTIIDNGELAFKIKAHLDEYGMGDNYKLDLLEVKND